MQSMHVLLMLEGLMVQVLSSDKTDISDSHLHICY